MVSFIFGTAKSGKTKEIIKLLNNSTDSSETVLFVPEQFSFEAERLTINNLDSLSFHNTSVLNFTRLCDEVKRLYGGNAGTIIDNSTRLMLIIKTIKSLKNELLLFNKTEAVSNYINSVSSAIVELKQAGATAEQLKAASIGLSNSVLGLKLHDLSLILSSYDALVGSVYIDPIDDLDFSYDKISKNGYFRNKRIIFDSFTGFTGQQFNIIKQAIIDADEVCFSMCTDGDFSKEFGIFANVNSTALKIISLAERENVKIAKPIILESSYFKSKSIAAVDKIIRAEDVKHLPEDADVSIISADNKYDELDFVAAEIHKLVREKSYRYRDFAIIARNSESYADVARNALNKCGVPCFIDEKEQFLSTPLASLILSALKASRNYNTDDIFKMLKTGLTDINQDEIALIDNYTYLWKIDGNEWLFEWTKNPYGMSESNAEDIVEKLCELNGIRKRTIDCIKHLNSLKSETAINFCKALFKFLESVNASKHLSEYVDSLKSSGFYNSAQYIISSWSKLMKMLDSIAECYSDDELTFKQFCDILLLNFENCSLGGIPQGLDEVVLYSAGRIAADSIKIAFVIGFNFGEFPLASKDTGLFNVSERTLLRSRDINIDDMYISGPIDEDFVVYKALTSATEKLYIMYHTNDYSNGKCEPSIYLDNICKNLNVKSTPLNFSYSFENIESKNQVFSLLASNFYDSPLSKSIVESLKADEFYKAKIEALNSIKQNKPPQLEPETALKLYGNTVYISPSGIEQYFKCPYSYYLKHGLKIEKLMQIDFKNMQRGTIAHYVLENILKDYLNEIQEFDDEKLNSVIDGYIEKYLIETVGNPESIGELAKYMLKRISEMLNDLVKYIAAELSESKFKPTSFEVHISDKGDVESPKFVSSGITIKLTGYVDRLDTCSCDEMNYAKIVDYKTGTKEFKLSDLLKGLNFQMFLYLDAICKSRKYSGKPAAVIYQPLNHIEKKGTSGKVKKMPKAIGLVTDDREVLNLLDPNAKYLPFGFNKDNSLKSNSKCISNDDFNEIFKYIEAKITAMGNSLVNGNINCNPCNIHNKINACTYCDYKSDCLKAVDAAENIEKLSDSEALDVIKECNKNAGKIH